MRLVMGPLRPRNKVLGQEFAGDVEAVGDRVTSPRVGDELFGTTGFRFGAYAEYLRLPVHAGDSAVGPKPSNMTYESAATVPTGGLEALRFLRRGGDLQGRQLLIIGGGGGIGTFAIQLGKYLGAVVTAVDRPEKMELLLSLGADRVIDFTREDYRRRGGSHDVVFDAVGRSSIAEKLSLLREGGIYLDCNPRPSTLVRGRWRENWRGRKLVVRAPAGRSEDLAFLRQLIEAGKITAVIDRTFPLDEVPEAHRYFESGLARGRIAITV